MKKIVLTVLLIIISFGAIGANEGKIDSILLSMESQYEIESVRMKGSLFRMMMPLMKIDRQTRKAFKAMNIEEIVITDFQDEPKQIASKVVVQLSEALEATGYMMVQQKEPASDEEVKVDSYALIESEKVLGMAILTHFPKASFLWIRCSMDIEKLEEMVGATIPK